MKVLGLGLVSLACMVVACSGDDGGGSSSGEPTSSSSGATSESSSSGGQSSSGGEGSSSGEQGSSSGEPHPDLKFVNGCGVSDYVDHTDKTEVEIVWNFDTQDCIHIKAGTTVTFVGNMMSHPLEATAAGDANNPILFTDEGESASFVFPEKGTFGYVCTFHTIMTGAIAVTE